MSDIISTVLMVIVGIALIAILMTIPVMLLWNWLMPEIFGLCKIGFWQAMGLSFLANCLTRGSSSSSSK